MSDSADGLSTLSHTKTVASYVPLSEGIHDNAGLNDCPEAKEPVIHANETVTPSLFCTCTKYANDWSPSVPFTKSASICTC